MRRGKLKGWLLAVGLALCWPVEARAQRIVFKDDVGDDYGGGQYVLPAREGFQKGTFDIEEVVLEGKGDYVEISVRFQRPITQVPFKRMFGKPETLIFLPVVDIYSRGSGSVSGHKRLLPGRRALPDEKGWEKAIVLSGIPDALEAHYNAVASDVARDVCFPRNFYFVGRELRSKVLKKCIADELLASQYLVVVTCLGPGGGFGRFSKEGREEDEDPYVRAVSQFASSCDSWEDGTLASSCVIGGCNPCGFHPYILDMVVPDGVPQEELLSNYDGKTKKLATLPFMDARQKLAKTYEQKEPKKSKRHKVLDVKGDIFTIEFDESDGEKKIEAGDLGAVICEGEKPGGVALVIDRFERGLVLKKVPDGIPLCKDAFVEF